MISFYFRPETRPPDRSFSHPEDQYGFPCHSLQIRWAEVFSDWGQEKPGRSMLLHFLTNIDVREGEGNVSVHQTL